MPTTRPFAYNTGSPIPGTTQVGSIAVGASALDYSSNPGGVKWWNGPDEDLGYVICSPVPSGNQPTPVGGSAFLGFSRSSSLSSSSFINLVNITFNQNFSTGSECKYYLESNGYWNSYPKGYLLDEYPSGSAYGWSVAFQLKSSATAAIQIRRSSDNTLRDIGFVNGALDVAGMTGWVGPTSSAFIRTIYEQNGSEFHFVQSNPSIQLRIINGGTLDTSNGNPAAFRSNTIQNTMSASTGLTAFNFMIDGTEASLFSVYQQSTGNNNLVTICGTYRGSSVSRGFNVWGRYNTGGNGSFSINGYNTSGSVIYNGFSANNIGSNQVLAIGYVDGNNPTASERAVIYLNGGTASKNNIYTGSYTSGNSETTLTLGGWGYTPDYFQELIIFKSHPDLNTIRTEIDSRYNIY